ncbi:MAG: hypothetical protein DSZ03_00790 [Sulfurimonas sp.]|nr:MAG: hypothetical protein DSZ03_00790 [Sulfurimonas sp.]
MLKGTKSTVTYFNTFVILILLLFATPSSAKDSLQNVSLQLQWLDQFQFAGYYVAREKGFYRDVGLDVTIKPYHKELSPVNEVITGNATYGTGRSTLLLERSFGAPVVLLAAIFQSSPLILLGLKRTDLNTTDDFKGKRLMALPETTSSVAMQAMIASQGVAFSDMTLLPHSLALEDLINGNTDLMACYISNEPYRLQQQGYDYTVFDPKTYGFDFYGDLLFTSETEAYEHPERTTKFLEASLKGWIYAFSHIEETAALIFTRYNTQNKTLKALQYEGQILKQLAYKNGVALGDLDYHKLQNMFDMYKIMQLHQKDIAIDDILFSKHKLKFNNREKAYMNQTKIINVCMDLDFPPYTLKDISGYNGISIDFFNLLSEKSGLIFNFIPVKNRAEAAIYLQQKRCTLVPHISTHKTTHPLLEPTHSYLHDNLAMVTSIKRPYINDLSDIQHKKIAIISGVKHVASQLHKRYPNLQLIEVLSPEVAFKKVRDGEFYGFLGPYRSLSYAIQKSYIGELKIAIKLDAPPVDVSIGVARHNPILLNILNKTLHAITPEERHDIYQRWITTNTIETTDYTFLIQLMSVMALIVAIFLYRQSLLKKKNLELEQLQNELETLNHLLEKKVTKAVSELRKKDQLMMQQSRLAQLGEMISMIAHQWRQPLAAISSTVVGIKLKNALNKFDLSKEKERQAYQQYLNDNFEQIENYILTLSNTIDDFRNFYKSEKISTYASINGTLEKTFKIIESALATENIILVKRFHSKHKLLMYENELLQVFLNLIKNAQDNFHERRIEKAVLTITTFDVHEGIGVEICDNGGGIDESIHNQIYDPYFSTKNKKNGTGLGLYMSKMIVEEHHHGKLTHYNKNGGVCFSIMIPLN